MAWVEEGQPTTVEFCDMIERGLAKAKREYDRKATGEVPPDECWTEVEQAIYALEEMRRRLPVERVFVESAHYRTAVDEFVPFALRGIPRGRATQ